jgi:hypothetical protein
MNPSTPVVAWYAAVVSTLGFFLALYVALRDRPRLRISVQPNMRRFGSPVYDEDKFYVVVTVANIGRRPLTVGLVGFTQRRKGGDIILTDSTREGAKDIPEGKSATYLAEQAALPLTNLKHVLVRDNAGRIWKRRVPKNVRYADSAPATSANGKSGAHSASR